MQRPGGSIELKVAATTPLRNGAAPWTGAFPRTPLYVLAILALIAGLYAARAFLVPLLIGTLASYALKPIVDWLERVHIPRAGGAVLVVGTAAGALVWGVASLGDNAIALVERLPSAAHQLRQSLAQSRSGAAKPLQQMQQATAELQRAAKEAAGDKPPPPGAAAAPTVEDAWLQKYLISQSTLLISMVAQAPVLFLLIYFLLASGDNFRGKLLRLIGMSRKESIDLLQEVDSQVQRYLLLTVVINALVGAFTGLAFWALGVEQPALWGVAAGVLHFIPYLGPAIIAAASGAAAFLQFGSVLDAAGVAGASLAVSGAIGLVIMTWLQSRIARLNTALLFIVLLFFGWLWGACGLLLGAPLLAIAKVISDRVESLKPVAELLGH